MYHGEQVKRPPLGIKPTPADHKFVAALSIMGITVREICVRLGERYKLGKPMSRMTLYWHFRKDLTRHVAGRRKMYEVKDAKRTETVQERMKRLLAKIDEKSGGKARKHGTKSRPCQKCGTIFSGVRCLNCARTSIAERRAKAKQTQQTDG